MLFNGCHNKFMFSAIMAHERPGRHNSQHGGELQKEAFNLNNKTSGRNGVTTGSVLSPQKFASCGAFQLFSVSLSRFSHTSGKKHERKPMNFDCGMESYAITFA